MVLCVDEKSQIQALEQGPNRSRDQWRAGVRVPPEIRSWSRRLGATVRLKVRSLVRSSSNGPTQTLPTIFRIQEREAIAMSEAADGASGGASSVRRNLLLVASYLALMTLIAVAYV